MRTVFMLVSFSLFIENCKSEIIFQQQVPRQKDEMETTAPGGIVADWGK